MRYRSKKKEEEYRKRRPLVQKLLKKDHGAKHALSSPNMMSFLSTGEIAAKIFTK